VDSYSAVRDAWLYRRDLDWCVVAPRGDDAYPVSARLYRGLGFRDRGRSLRFYAGSASDAQS
jgi:hypothetical protein